MVQGLLNTIFIGSSVIFVFQGQIVLSVYYCTRDLESMSFRKILSGATIRHSVNVSITRVVLSLGRRH